MIQLATRLLARYSHVNWALADQAMVSGVNFLIAILLARYLGLEEFGRFTLAWIAVQFVKRMQHAMIISPMMSIGPKQSKAETPAYFGAVIVHQTAFVILVFFVLLFGVVLSHAFFPEWRVLGLAFPLASVAVAYQLQDFLRRYFFTRGRAAEAFVNDAVCYLGQLVAMFWLFHVVEMDAARALWVIAAAAAAAMLLGLRLVERIEWDRATVSAIALHHWHFSKWLTFSALLQWTRRNLFLIAAGGVLGISAVGALRAARILMGVTHIVFLGLENVVPIRAARHFHQSGRKALVQYLLRVALAGGGVTAAVAAIAAATPDFWLELLFGGSYSGYGYLLRWYAVIYLLIFTGLPLAAGLRAVENTQAIFRASLWVTVFSVFAAYPLVNTFGLVGAVSGIVITHGINLVILGSAFAKRCI